MEFTHIVRSQYDTEPLFLDYWIWIIYFGILSFKKYPFCNSKFDDLVNSKYSYHNFSFQFLIPLKNDSLSFTITSNILYYILLKVTYYQYYNTNVYTISFRLLNTFILLRYFNISFNTSKNDHFFNLKMSHFLLKKCDFYTQKIILFRSQISSFFNSKISTFFYSKMTQFFTQKWFIFHTKKWVISYLKNRDFYTPKTPLLHHLSLPFYM